MPGLPTEIWFYISTFLTDSEIWLVRAVNRILFHSALDRHYRSTQIYLDGMKKDREYVELFRSLRRPIVVDRVREIVFIPRFYPFDERGLDPKWMGRLPVSSRGFKGRIMDLFIGKRESMIDILSKFRNATSLQVNYSRMHSTYANLKFMPIITSTLRTHSSQLSSLHINDSGIEEVLALLSGSILFPKLECLSIRCRYSHRYGSRNSEPILPGLKDLLIPFFNRHRSTLRVLRFAAPDGYDSTELFTNVEHISHLETLQLENLYSTKAQPIRRFIHMHSRTLRDLHIVDSLAFASQGQNPVETLLQDLEGVELPKLRILSTDTPIAFVTGALPATLLVDCVKQYASSLSQLRMRGKMLLEDDWRNLIMANWSSLEHLQLELNYATPQTFDSLVEQFPSLISLTIQVRSFRHGVGCYESHQFCVALNQRRYESCRLLCMTVTPETIPHTWMFGRCAAAVAEAFVSVQTFNDVTRKAYLAREADTVDPHIDMVSGDVL